MQVNVEYKVGDVVKFQDFDVDGKYFLFPFDIGCINYIDEKYDTCSIFSFKGQRLKDVIMDEIAEYYISQSPDIDTLKEL